MLINSIRWRPNAVEESRRLLSLCPSFIWPLGHFVHVHLYGHVFVCMCRSFSLCTCLCMCELCYCPEPVAAPCVLQIYPAPCRKASGRLAVHLGYGEGRSKTGSLLKKMFGYSCKWRGLTVPVSGRIGDPIELGTPRPQFYVEMGTLA